MKKVSVHMITYNHEKFIAQAIESVLMQEVNFDYEIVIGEDCSTDNTRNIVIDYQKKYPDKIRLLLHEKNVGGKENDVQTFKACQGQYITWLEGDDYWISSQKLQKQVDFLDHHPDCAICFHNTIAFYEDNSHKPWHVVPSIQKEISTIEDLLVENFIPTSAAVFRRDLFGELPDWYYTSLVGDWSLNILNAQYGKIGYIDEVMSAHRLHSEGVWSRLSPVYQLQVILEFYDTIDSYLNFKYNKIIEASRLKHWDHLAEYLVGEANTKNSVQAATQYLFEQFDQWPDRLPLPDAWKAQILSKIYAHFGFESYRKHDLPMARYCWFRAIRYDPSWLLNRGVWSILTEAFLGQRITGWLRGRLRQI